MMSKGESGQILFKGPTQQAEVKKSNVQYQDEWRASLTNQGTLGSDAVRSLNYRRWESDRSIADYMKSSCQRQIRGVWLRHSHQPSNLASDNIPFQ